MQHLNLVLIYLFGNNWNVDDMIFGILCFIIDQIQLFSVLKIITDHKSCLILIQPVKTSSRISHSESFFRMWLFIYLIIYS